MAGDEAEAGHVLQLVPSTSSARIAKNSSGVNGGGQGGGTQGVIGIVIRILARSNSSSSVKCIRFRFMNLWFAIKVIVWQVLGDDKYIYGFDAPLGRDKFILSREGNVLALHAW